MIAHVNGTQELTNADVRGAVGDLWGAYLGDLLTWTLGVTAIALLVAVASAPVASPYSARAGLRRLRALALGRHDSERARALRGAIVLVLGVLLITEPLFALRVAAVVCGCLLVYVGFGELLSATAPDPARVWRPRLSASPAGDRDWCVGRSYSRWRSTSQSRSPAARELCTPARSWPATDTRSCVGDGWIEVVFRPARTTRCRRPTRRAG